MNRGFVIGLVGLVAAGALASAPAASAKDEDVIRRGNCNGSSDWELKLSPEDGKIEVEFEVDQNVRGDDWRVILRKDGKRFFRGVRTTSGDSGSFEVEKLTRNGGGDERIKARARNLETDEVCRGKATAKF